MIRLPSGDNVVVITILERRCVLKERTVGTSLIGIRNATLTANSSPDFSLIDLVFVETR